MKQSKNINVYFHYDFMNRRLKKLPIILKQIWKQIELFICDAKLKSQQVPPETYFSGP